MLPSGARLARVLYHITAPCQHLAHIVRGLSRALRISGPIVTRLLQKFTYDVS